MIVLMFAPLIAAIPAINATVLNNEPTLWSKRNLIAVFLTSSFFSGTISVVFS